MKLQNYTQFINEDTSNLTIQDYAWLFFLSYLYKNGMKLNDWERDNRMGVKFPVSLQKLIDAKLATIIDGAARTYTKTKQILIDYFHASDLDSAIEYSRELSAINYNCDYNISTIPVEIVVHNNLDIFRNSIYNELITSWYNKPEQKYIKKIIKVEGIELLNKYKWYETFNTTPPNKLTIHRGIKSEYRPSEKNVFESWTTSRKEAERFAKWYFSSSYFDDPRESEKQYILSIEIPWSAVDVFIGGKEEEVVINSKKVSNPTVERIK